MSTDTHLYVHGEEDTASWNVQVFRSIDSGEELAVVEYVTDDLLANAYYIRMA